MMENFGTVFLAGGPRRGFAEDEIGCPSCWYPIGRTETILQGWIQVISEARISLGLPEMNAGRLVFSEDQPCFNLARIFGVDVVCEARSHRGTAGVIRDNCENQLSGEGAVLIVEPAASPAVDLCSMLNAWASMQAGPFTCLLGESSLGRYCGVMLCSAQVFDLVPQHGFFDLKEQLIPQIRARGGAIDSVVVADRARRVRSRAEWLAVAQAWAKRELARSDRAFRAVVGDHLGRGNVISGSAMTRGSRVIDSIVMTEAIIEPGGLVARSVIGPGVRVPDGARVIDAILGDPESGEAAVRRLALSATVPIVD